jgi:hypothetical protein
VKKRNTKPLDELLPETSGLNNATTRNRTLAVGKRIEQEISEAIDHPRVLPEPAKSKDQLIRRSFTFIHSSRRYGRGGKLLQNAASQMIERFTCWSSLYSGARRIKAWVVGCHPTESEPPFFERLIQMPLPRRMRFRKRKPIKSNGMGKGMHDACYCLRFGVFPGLKAGEAFPLWTIQ